MATINIVQELDGESNIWLLLFVLFSIFYAEK